MWVLCAVMWVLPKIVRRVCVSPAGRIKGMPPPAFSIYYTLPSENVLIRHSIVHKLASSKRGSHKYIRMIPKDFKRTFKNPLSVFPRTDFECPKHLYTVSEELKVNNPRHK